MHDSRVHDDKRRAGYRRAKGLVLLAACALLASGCGGSDLRGKDWVNTGNAVKMQLTAEGVPYGVLYIDRRFHPLVRNNIQGFVVLVAKVFKDKHLFNRSPTPLEIYYLYDADDFAKYCAVRTEARAVFVRAERSVYIHADGRQLIDGGRQRSLVREIARCVMHDMYAGAYPAWMELGITRLFADGAFGMTRKDGEKPPVVPGSPRDVFADFDWLAGLPDPEMWRPALAGQLPSFEAVRVATAEELEAMGEPAKAVATAAVYLLSELGKLKTVVWQVQLTPQREPSDVLGIMRKYDPRYPSHFKDPVASYFKLRPDVRQYLESSLAGGKAEVLARVQANAAGQAAVGGYWWQYGAMLLDAGKRPEAVAALEKSRNCVAHRHQPEGLARLADIYYEQKKWTELESVAKQQLGSSVLPTPRMYLMLAESLRERDVQTARTMVQYGLDLPPDGFGPEHERLRALQTELGQ